MDDGGQDRGLVVVARAQELELMLASGCGRRWCRRWSRCRRRTGPGCRSRRSCSCRRRRPAGSRRGPCRRRSQRRAAPRCRTGHRRCSGPGTARGSVRIGRREVIRLGVVLQGQEHVRGQAQLDQVIVWPRPLLAVSIPRRPASGRPGSRRLGRERRPPELPGQAGDLMLPVVTASRGRRRPGRPAGCCGARISGGLGAALSRPVSPMTYRDSDLGMATRGCWRVAGTRRRSRSPTTGSSPA